jgi:hypothetical protein
LELECNFKLTPHKIWGSIEEEKRLNKEKFQTCDMKFVEPKD